MLAPKVEVLYCEEFGYVLDGQGVAEREWKWQSVLGPGQGDDGCFVESDRGLCAHWMSTSQTETALAASKGFPISKSSITQWGMRRHSKARLHLFRKGEVLAGAADCAGGGGDEECRAEVRWA